MKQLETFEILTLNAFRIKGVSLTGTVQKRAAWFVLELLHRQHNTSSMDELPENLRWPTLHVVLAERHISHDVLAERHISQ